MMTRKTNLSIFFAALFFFSLAASACDGPAAAVPFQAVDIQTDGEGIYVVSESEIENLGMHFPSQGGISLQFMGKTVPAWLMESNDLGTGRSVVFYVPPPSSRYANGDTYQLVPSTESMPLLKSLPPGLARSESSVQTSLHLEKNLIYEPQALALNPFYWETISATQPMLIPFELADIDQAQEASVTISIHTRGATTIHGLEVKLNSQVVSTNSWSWSDYQYVVDIPPGILQRGSNAFKLSVSGEGSERMVVDLDWIELNYYSRSKSNNSFFHWLGDGTTQTLGGWEGMVIALPENWGDAWIAQAGFSGKISIPTIAEVKYTAANQANWRKPVSIRKKLDLPSLAEGFSGAEYLIISPDLWMADLEPLAGYYRGEGLKTSLVSIESIYDSFSSGQPDPFAILSYLKKTEEQWPLKPKYVLLVGDFVYDPLQLPKDGAYLPTFFIRTPFGGETVSDYPFGLGDVNGTPASFAVGRWPVNNRQEVQALVQNSINWNRKTAASPLQFLRIADPSNQAFAGEAYIFGKFTNAFDVTLYTVSTSSFPQEPIQDFTSINALVYFGHGSLTQWGVDPALTINELQGDRLKNIGLVLQFTCLSGYFASPGQDSLSEQLLKAGVPAVLGPSSLTLPDDQWNAIEKWAEMLQDTSMSRIGDVLASVWQKYYSLAAYAPTDVIETFIFFGDPALKIPWKTSK